MTLVDLERPLQLGQLRARRTIEPPQGERGQDVFVGGQRRSGLRVELTGLLHAGGSEERRPRAPGRRLIDPTRRLVAATGVELGQRKSQYGTARLDRVRDASHHPIDALLQQGRVLVLGQVLHLVEQSLERLQSVDLRAELVQAVDLPTGRNRVCEQARALDGAMLHRAAQIADAGAALDRLLPFADDVGCERERGGDEEHRHRHRGPRPSRDEARCPIDGTDPSRADRLSGEVSLELVGELSARSDPPRRVLLERSQQDRLQVAVPTRQTQRRGVVQGDAADEALRVFERERRAAGDRFMDRGAERVDVATRVERRSVALESLGRHVGERSGEHTLARYARIGLGPGQAEVDEDRHPVVEDHVGRLDVAMDHTGAMRGGERASDLSADLRPLPRSERRLQDFETGSAQPLHRQVQSSLILPQGVDRHDVRMLQRTRHLRLSPESQACLALRPHRVVEDLERDQPPERLLLREIDPTASPGAERGDEPELAESFERQLVRRHGRRSQRPRYHIVQLEPALDRAGDPLVSTTKVFQRDGRACVPLVEELAQHLERAWIEIVPIGVGQRHVAVSDRSGSSPPASARERSARGREY